MGTQNVPGTIHVANCAHELDRLVSKQHSIIVREYIPFSERIRLICVQFEPVGALRQVDAPQCDEVFTNNVHTETLSVRTDEAYAATLEPVPLNSAALTKPLGITKQLLRAARLDDILIEWGNLEGKWQLIGMARPPVRWRTPQGTMDRHHYICELIQSGIL